jgi:hypothetical protein
MCISALRFPRVITTFAMRTLLPMLWLSASVAFAQNDGFFFESLLRRDSTAIPMFSGFLKDDAGDFALTEKARKQYLVPEGPISCGMYTNAGKPVRPLAKTKEVLLTSELWSVLFFPDDFEWDKAVLGVQVSQKAGNAGEVVLFSRGNEYSRMIVKTENTSQLWIEGLRFVEHDEARQIFVIDFVGANPVRYESRHYLMNWKGTPLMKTNTHDRVPKVQYDADGKPYYVEYICENAVTS